MVPPLSAWPLCLTTPETEPVPPPPHPASPRAAPTTRRPISFWFIASNRLDNAAAQVAADRHLRRNHYRERDRRGVIRSSRCPGLRRRWPSVRTTRCWG